MFKKMFMLKRTFDSKMNSCKSIWADLFFVNSDNLLLHFKLKPNIFWKHLAIVKKQKNYITNVQKESYTFFEPL